MCFLPVPTSAITFCSWDSLQHVQSTLDKTKKDSEKVTTQAVLTCSLQTEYFIHPITGNYSINSHAEST